MEKKDQPQRPVVASLPGNVLVNDQLTPIRSQIEGAAGFLPEDIARHANFVTDDRTALAVHISAKYPTLADRLEPGEFAALVRRIITSRKALDREIGLLPIPPNGAKFQAKWSELLARRNRQAE
jgi:hypothetical protein